MKTKYMMIFLACLIPVIAFSDKKINPEVVLTNTDGSTVKIKMDFLSSTSTNQQLRDNSLLNTNWKDGSTSNGKTYYRYYYRVDGNDKLHDDKDCAYVKEKHRRFAYDEGGTYSGDYTKNEDYVLYKKNGEKYNAHSSYNSDSRSTTFCVKQISYDSSGNETEKWYFLGSFQKKDKYGDNDQDPLRLHIKDVN